MITRIYHKKNELFQIEFYQDEECQQAFNFENIKNLYIELKDGDCNPILSLSNKLWGLNIKANTFTPTWYWFLKYATSSQTPVITLNDVLDNIDLSKYIPKDNAVLFLSEEDVIFQPKAGKGLVWKSITYSNHKGKGRYRFREIPYPEVYETLECLKNRVITDKITIFLTHGTESELKKVNEIAQELKEKHGVDEVNLFVLHCFGYLYGDDYIIVGFKKENNFNTRLILDKFIDKVITTNSTGISEHQDKERLQILDCYDIFNDYLKGE